jgi:hypothetical protein
MNRIDGLALFDAVDLASPVKVRIQARKSDAGGTV